MEIRPEGNALVAPGQSPNDTLVSHVSIPSFSAVRNLRRAMIGVMAALVSGIAVGVVARILMRAVTVSADHEGDFSVSGSFFIVLIYGVAMIPLGVVAALTTRWWRWLAAAAGSIFLFFPAVGVASEEIGSTDGLSPVRWVFLVTTSLAVFATIVIVAFVTVALVDRWTNRSSVRHAEFANA